MIEIINKYKFVITLAIVTVALVIMLKRCGNIANPNLVIRDTVTNTITKVRRDTLFIEKQIPVGTIAYMPSEKDTVYLQPSENHDELVAQYKELRNQFIEDRKLYLSEKHYDQIIPIDTIGTLRLIDTLRANELRGRRLIADYKIPHDTTVITVTKTAPAKNKWFIGGGVGVTSKSYNDINIGIGLLNKKDQLFEAKLRPDFKGNVVYELNTYWKIHF